MCRLLGLYADKPIAISSSFYKSLMKRFEELSRKQRDGWVLRGSMKMAGMSTRSPGPSTSQARLRVSSRSVSADE